MLCCNYPRSVCVRTAPGNVSMVAHGKINTRLSPVLRLAYHRPLSRRLDRCDRVIQNESRDPFGGNVYYVTMQITSLTRNFRNGERNLHCYVVHITTKWVSSLTLDCNGVFAIKAYSSSVLYVLLYRPSTGLQAVVVVYLLALPCKMVFALGYRACSRIKIQKSKNTSSCERNLQSIKRRSFKALRILILTAMFMPSPMPPI